MKKNIVASFIVGGVCLGTIQLTPTFASEDSTERYQNTKLEMHTTLSTEEKKEVNLRPSRDASKNLPSFLEKYGISTEGKSAEEIQNELIKHRAIELGISTEGKDAKEIKFAVLEAEAKKEGIKTEGKDEAAILKELQQTIKSSKPSEEKLRQLDERKQNAKFLSILKENGISPEGKSLEELQKSIYFAKAKELGISTNGKSLKDLQKEIQSKLIILKAQELEISTDGKDEQTILKEIKEAESKKDEVKKGRR